MIDGRRFLLGASASVAALAFAAGYGEGLAPVGAYLLAGVLGVLAYSWTDRPGQRGGAGVVIGSYILGATVSLLLGAGLFAWFLGTPIGIALWQSWLRLLFPWLGVASALLTGVFLTGLAAAFG